MVVCVWGGGWSLTVCGKRDFEYLVTSQLVVHTSLAGSISRFNIIHVHFYLHNYLWLSSYFINLGCMYVDEDDMSEREASVRN